MAGALDDSSGYWRSPVGSQGPAARALMADMGAEVIKVEPLTGDGMRGKLRQPSAPEGVAVHDVPFQFDNRGKRSVAVDLTSEAGAALVREMATGVDVVVTNLLPARLARYGSRAPALCVANPRLVYALVTGYGEAWAPTPTVRRST